MSITYVIILTCIITHSYLDNWQVMKDTFGNRITQHQLTETQLLLKLSCSIAQAEFKPLKMVSLLWSIPYYIT